MLSEGEADRARDLYVERGWLRKMRHQVEQFGGTLHAVPFDDPLMLFNVSFHPGDAHLLGYDSMPPLPAGHVGQRSARYVLSRLGDGIGQPAAPPATER